ncbi:hypothetical protein VTN77DRAFT_2429 [Rasamsonia byssochlamydoides]|uniref:uncharacterized protein n=1 Tax=Rasamsonia byssochlamydoides TaxID=89139 RepID=UPI00374475B1
MATSSSGPAPAPWRAPFEENLSKLEDPYFAVSTVARDPATGVAIPRVRYCGFRGFFGELKLHPSAEKQLEDEDGGKNPSIFESDMLSFTTDVRMGKVEQLTQQSDGGIEVVFWIKEAMTQWRMSGKAFIIGDAADQKHEQDARREIQRGLRRKQNSSDGDEKQWSWEKEVTMYFANHSPVMRGTFKNPPPGRPITENPDPTLKLGQKVTDLHDPIARRHFRVVVIRVEEVDRLDLVDHAESKRWRWTFVSDGHGADGGDGRWEEVEVWP